MTRGTSDLLRAGPARLCVLAASLLLAPPAQAGPAPAADCPPAGADSFESQMNVILTVPGIGTSSLDLEGPVTVVRGAPRLDGALSVIDTEIVAMELTGMFLGNPMILRQSPEFPSVGEVRSQGASSCFLADSFFDVFVEVEIQSSSPLELENLQAVRLQAGNLAKLPPLFDTYTHPPPAIPLVAKGTSGPAIATIEGESSHGPVQRPTFSIASGGSLEAAAGLEPPKPPQITLTRNGLGLQAGDDLDALSYGVDPIDAKPHTILAFSVDAASLGAPGTGVRQESTTGEQESAEYVSYTNGSNQLLVPGDLLVPVTGDQPAGDDVDALTDFEATVVDTDDDQIPEEPVFLSLAAGSPTLTGLSASAADVLVSQDGTIGVYATAADIGLASGDDIDAFCLMKSGLPLTNLRPGPGPAGPPFPGPQLFDSMLFSLATGSPTLAAQGHTAADVFVTDFSNNRPTLASQPLALYAEDFELGLQAGDDLNALKCLRASFQIEIADDGDLVGDGSGCGDEERDIAVSVDRGLLNHSGDHLALPAAALGLLNYFQLWSVQNPHAGDAHGPFAYPNTPASSYFPTGDPANPLHANFVGGPGDNCGLPHIHGGLFGIPLFDFFGFHADPDTPACGHGVFVPHPFPIFVIPTRRSNVEIFIRAFVQYLNSLVVPISPGFRASWRRYTGETSLPIGLCTNLQTRRYMLTLSGLAITQMNLQALGQYSGMNLGDPQSSLAAAAPDPSVSLPLPLRFGAPMRSVAPVPEPGAGAAGLVATLALGALARRRTRRARLSGSGASPRAGER